MGEARRPWWRSVVASLIGGLLGSALVVLAGFGHWLVAAGLLVAVVLAETWWYWVGIPWAIARRARRAHRHCAYCGKPRIAAQPGDRIVITTSSNPPERTR